MMEEVQKYLAKLGNVPEEDKDFLKARSCIVSISVGHEAHEDEKFRATMKMVNLRFKKCVISVSDILQRYSISAKDPLQRSPEEFYEYSKELGDEWLERNIPIIEEELKIPYEIMRWDDYVKNPKFQDRHKQVIDLFENNHEYQDVIKKTARDFLTRSFVDLNINISPERFCKLSEEYLLEESAAFLEWVDKKYDYELYPSMIGAFIKKTFDLLMPEESKNIAHRLKIKFEKIAKEKEPLLESKVAISLENIMEIAPENIFWKNKYGTMLGSNLSNAQRLNCKNINDSVGKTDFDFYDFDKAMEIRKNDLYVMQTNKKLIIEENVEVDGKWKYYLSYKQPLRDKNNNSIGIVGVSVDISKQKQLEQELIVKNQELERALSARDELLNNVSHEIKTPLSAILSITDVLYSEWDNYNDDSRKEYLGIAVKANDRLRSILANLMDLSQLKAGKMTYCKERFSLAQSVGDVVGEFLHQQHRFIIEDRTGGVEAVYDPPRIEQVVRNFVANALKYGGNDNFKITIDQDGDDKLSVSIQDRGVGVAEDEREAIFDIFTQSSRTKTRAGGSGIGLSICKTIIKDHGGEIGVKNNEDNVGSNFYFTLPIKNNVPRKQIKPTDETVGFIDFAKQREDEKKPLALVIDDEDLALRSTSLNLQAVGFRVVTADGGIEGLEVLKDNHDKVGVILLDLMMPDIYGFDLLKMIKGDPELKHIPVFMHSGMANSAEKQTASTLGAAGFIDKSCSSKEILKEKLGRFLL